MRYVLTGLAIGCLLLLGRPAASAAAPIRIDFAFTNGASTLAEGSFVFDSVLDGSVLAYEDLSSFEIVTLGVPYDLAFVNSGNFTEFRYFAFDSSVDAFEVKDISGFPHILSAIKTGFGIGFFISDFPNQARVVTEYSTGQANVEWTGLEIRRTSFVPEPATLLLFAVGGAAALRRSRRRATHGR
jgi:PEP-CTERM motif